MRSLLQRAWLAVSPVARTDRRNIAALASHLCLPADQAGSLYRRSRDVGFPTAIAEHLARADAEDAEQALTAAAAAPVPPVN